MLRSPVEKISQLQFSDLKKLNRKSNDPKILLITDQLLVSTLILYELAQNGIASEFCIASHRTLDYLARIYAGIDIVPAE